MEFRLAANLYVAREGRAVSGWPKYFAYSDTDPCYDAHSGSGNESHTHLNANPFSNAESTRGATSESGFGRSALKALSRCLGGLEGECSEHIAVVLPLQE